MKTHIATFYKRPPARALKDRFQAAGIPAWVKDDSLLQRLVFWTRPFAFIKVYVDGRQFQRARDLLGRWNQEDHVLDAAVRCPECGSPRVEYPQFTRKFVTPLLIEWMISLGAGEKDCYCLDCHYTWIRRAKARAKELARNPRLSSEHGR